MYDFKISLSVHFSKKTIIFDVSIVYLQYFFQYYFYEGVTKVFKFPSITSTFHLSMIHIKVCFFALVKPYIREAFSM